MTSPEIGNLQIFGFDRSQGMSLDFMGINLPPMSNVGRDYIDKFGWYIEGQSSKESEYFNVSVLFDNNNGKTLFRMQYKLLAQYFSELREYSKDITGTYQEVTNCIREVLIEMSRATGGVAYSTSKMLKQIHAAHKDGGDSIFRPEYIHLYGVEIPLIHVKYSVTAKRTEETFYKEFSFFRAKCYKSYQHSGNISSFKLLIDHPGVKEPIVFIADSHREIHAKFDSMVCKWLMQEELVNMAKAYRKENNII